MRGPHLGVGVEHSRPRVVRDEVRNAFGELGELDVLGVVVIAQDAVHTCMTHV